MAGIKDSVKDRRKRDKVIEPDTTGSLTQHRGQHLVASAALVDINDRKALEYNRARRQRWQSDAWEYVSEIGELSYVIDFMSNLQSKVRLFAAIRPDSHAPPMPIDDEAAPVDPTNAKIALGTLARLHSEQGGQAAIQHDIAYNWQVAGECFLHASTNSDDSTEDWNIRSVDELVIKQNEYTLMASSSAASGQRLSANDSVTRLWVKNNRFSSLATSPLRPLLGVCESLQLLSREIRSTAKSRASAGILLIPEELSFGPVDPTRDSSDGEGADDPFVSDLIETLIAPIQNEGSAAAVAPMVIRGPADYLDKVRHITLDRPLDSALDSRIEQLIMRIARGLNAPVEVTTGLQETTFANASQVKKSEWDSHGEPMMIMMCDALTVGYFRPALLEAGVPAEVAAQMFIWGDPTEAIAAPDPADNAGDAYRDFVISDEARRRVQGFSEADAPDDDELLRRLLQERRFVDPTIVGQVLKASGLMDSIVIPAAPGSTQPAEAVAGNSDQTQAVPVTASASRAILRKAESNHLGKKLMDIDRSLRTRLVTAADAALKKALDKAGNRVVSKTRRDKSASVASVTASLPPRQIPGALGPSLIMSLGLTDDELLQGAFEQFASDFDRWVAAAQAGAVNQIGKKTPLTEAKRTELAQRQNADRKVAWESLYESLLELARTKLYETSSITAALTPLGEDDGAFEVPASLIRKSMAQAGGDTGAWIDITGAVLGTDNQPVSGVGTSSSLLAATDISVEAYQWSHGSPQVSFEPHEALDGQVFIEFGDDALENGMSYPETDSLFPGDHPGCQCDTVPIVAPVEQVDYLFE